MPTGLLISGHSPLLSLSGGLLIMVDLLHLSFQQVLLRLTVIPVAAATIIGWMRFRHLPLNLRYLVALLTFVLPIEILGLVLMMLRHNNLFLMPIYTTGEFWLMAMVYRHTLQSPAFTRVMPWLAGAFTLYALFDSFLAPDGLARFRPGQQVVQSILLLLLVALYFRKLLSELQVQRLQREPMFWVSAGLLVYLFGYLQIALFSEYLMRYSEQFGLSIWSVHSLLYIGLYCCYCRALWVHQPK